MENWAKDFCLCGAAKATVCELQYGTIHRAKWHYLFRKYALLLRRLYADAVLRHGRNGCTQPRHDLLADADALLHMGKTRQDELIDAQTPVGQEFVSHLLRRPDDGGTTVNLYCGQAIPEMRVDTMLGDTRALWWTCRR